MIITLPPNENSGKREEKKRKTTLGLGTRTLATFINHSPTFHPLTGWYISSQEPAYERADRWSLISSKNFQPFSSTEK
jgi:hypothetical protein